MPSNEAGEPTQAVPEVELPPRPIMRTHDVEIEPWDIRFCAVSEVHAYADAMEAKLRAALQAQADGGWVSVEADLPVGVGEVQCWAGCYINASCRYDAGHGGRIWYHPLRSRITHWRPLPAPPTPTERPEQEGSDA